MLRDFGSDINAARIDIARNDQRISILDFRRVLEENLSEIERLYWSLDQAVRTVMIQERVLDDTVDTLRVLNARFVQGLDASRIQVAQAESSVKSRQADLIRAKQDVRDLSDQIKRRMNDPSFPLFSPTVIVPTDGPLTEPIEFNMEDQIQTAAENRLELGQQQIRIESARIAQRVAYNNRLPRLDLVGSIGNRGLGDTAGEAFSSNADFNTPSYAIGIEFEYPIGNRAARSVLQRAVLQRLQAVEQYQNLLQQVALDVKLSLNDIESSWDQAIARQQARLATADQLALLQRQEDLGQAITPSFVQIKLQAQEQLASAARDEVAAVANYNIAIQRLERSKGTLLRYNHVNIEEDPTHAYQRRAWSQDGNR